LNGDKAVEAQAGEEILAMIATGIVLATAVSQMMMATTPANRLDTAVTIFDFGQDGSDWRIIDDGVMGGRSQGAWEVSKDTGLFSGELSLENNGGFSSVRSRPMKTVRETCNAIRLRVKGDGRTYQFRARTNGNFDGASYREEFATTGEWQEVVLPLSAFEPTFRGRILEGRPPLTAGSIVTVGFLLADKKPGDFALAVDWIRLESVESQTAESINEDSVDVALKR
jgi:NADH dehydrogenase [ubiquinone] 1 alpha subcomplex assembly factor 1